MVFPVFPHRHTTIDLNRKVRVRGSGCKHQGLLCGAHSKMDAGAGIVQPLQSAIVRVLLECTI